MRELEKKTQLLAKKSDNEMKRIGMTDAARDLAAEKVPSLPLSFSSLFSAVLLHRKVRMTSTVNPVKFHP